MQDLKCQLGHVRLSRLDFKLFSAVEVLREKRAKKLFSSSISVSFFFSFCPVGVLVTTLSVQQVVAGLSGVLLWACLYMLNVTIRK